MFDFTMFNCVVLSTNVTPTDSEHFSNSGSHRVDFSHKVVIFSAADFTVCADDSTSFSNRRSQSIFYGKMTRKRYWLMRCARVSVSACVIRCDLSPYGVGLSRGTGGEPYTCYQSELLASSH